MQEKLEALRARTAELAALLQQPQILRDRQQYATLRREYAQKEPLAAVYEEYLAAQRQQQQAEELLQDEELAALAAQEVQTAQKTQRAIWQKLQSMLAQAAQDTDDDRAVVMEIRAGAGGEEAALFAADLYRMYCMYATRRGFHTELMSQSETELGGLREVCFLVNGTGAYARLKYESGVHRVQRVPRTESQGRIQTSTATVAVLPQADQVEVELLPAQLKIESCKSSGAGGQHINKTESAIRITHLPTGIVVECQDERSQFKNKDKALRILRAKLYERERTAQQERIAGQRRAQVGTADRSERIRTYNFPQGRVSDHRINLTLYSLEGVLNGDMDRLIDALLAAQAAQQSDTTSPPGQTTQMQIQ